MRILTQQANIVEFPTDLLIVNLFEGVTWPGGATGAVDKALGGRISQLIALGDCTGKLGQMTLVHSLGALPAKRVLVAGLGDRTAFDLAAVRTVAARAIAAAREAGVRTVATIVHGAGIGGLDPQAAAEAVVEASLLESYRMPRQTSETATPPQVEALTVVEYSAAALPAIEAGVRSGQVIAESVCLARDLIAAPSNLATPAYLAAAARAMAGEVGLDCVILDQPQMEALGMGILLAVAKGSDEPPQFVILEHNADRAGEMDTVVLVGKGVAFDTGGYSLKAGDAAPGMWRMKGDMTGAADVMATLRAAALLDLPLHVVGLAPLVENMISGHAQKPGDVYRGMSGKTMEVISTDAEGRMILADALAYAGRYPAKAVVDIATLTATVGLALGPRAAGLFTEDLVLRDRLMAAAAATGERLWPMPMYDEYRQDIRSDFADVKNSTLPNKTTGVSTSAKFLQHFTEGYPWAHIDMANMSWVESPRPLYPRGFSAFGTRLLIRFLRDWGAQCTGKGFTAGSALPATACQNVMWFGSHQ